MRLGFGGLRRNATAAMVAAATAGLALAPAAAAGFHGGGFHGGGGFGGGFHGGGYGGFHSGGYGGFHGGGYGGFRGGYGGYGYRGFGYRGFGGFGCCYGGFYGGFGYGYGDALLGAALIGTTAAVIAADEAPPYYETYPAPIYPAYPPPPPAGYAPPPPAGYAPAPPAYGYGDSAPPAAPQQPSGYASTDPVELCSRAAISEAGSRGDSGRMTKIERVDSFANGAHVSGTLEVRRADKNGAIENAHFTCTADYGQVTAFRFG